MLQTTSYLRAKHVNLLQEIEEICVSYEHLLPIEAVQPAAGVAEHKASAKYTGAQLPTTEREKLAYALVRLLRHTISNDGLFQLEVHICLALQTLGLSSYIITYYLQLSMHYAEHDIILAYDCSLSPLSFVLSAK